MDAFPAIASLLIRCTKCGHEKQRVEFYANRLRAYDARKSPRGGGLTCKTCMKANWERFKRANPLKYFFDRVRHRAKQEGTEFTIAESDIFISTHCPILGIELAPPGMDQSDPAAPSLDRLDSSKGYVPGNVAVISRLANVMKGGATAEQHERIAAWMRAHGAR